MSGPAIVVVSLVVMFILAVICAVILLCMWLFDHDHWVLGGTLAFMTIFTLIATNIWVNSAGGPKSCVRIIIHGDHPQDYVQCQP